MKKQLLSASLILSMGVSAQVTNIINRGFEDWDVVNAPELNKLTDFVDERISGGGIIDSLPLVQSSDAVSGNYSVLLKTMLDNENDTVFGYFINGEYGDNGPQGGEPSAYAADSLVGWYKCNIVPQDTAFIMLFLKSNGQTIAGGQYPFVGSQSSWKRFAFHTNYLGGAVDTIFYGAVSSNVLEDDTKAKPGSWLQLDDLKLVKAAGGSQSLSNSDFENWTNNEFTYLNDWSNVKYTTSRTNNSHSGSYAASIAVKEFTHGDGKKDTIGGIITNYEFDNNDKGGTPYVGMATSLEAYIDYTASPNDTGFLNIAFYKNGVSVGSSGIQFTTTTNGYQQFTLPITLTQLPDTFKMAMYAGDSIGTQMVIDDLNLVSNLTGVVKTSVKTTNIYPNPSAGLVTINSDGYAFQVVDELGRIVLAQRLNGNTEVSLNKGVYAVQIFNTLGELIGIEKLIIK